MKDVGVSQGGNSQSDDFPHPRPQSLPDRVERWQAEAMSALRRFYGTQCEAGHMAAIVLALIREREALIDYIVRAYPIRDDQRIH